MKQYVHIKTWSQMFMAILFISAKTGKNPNTYQKLNE